jgi:hypothetical protein
MNMVPLAARCPYIEVFTIHKWYNYRVKANGGSAEPPPFLKPKE